MFVGRDAELTFLQERYEAPGGQLVVLYGRRRVGKTETLRMFCRDKAHVFYACREVADAEQLRAFSERVLKAGVPAARYVRAFANWETALGSVADLPAAGGKKLLILDEFPYMCRGNAAIPSLLQNLWDETLKAQDVMLILCGSAMSFIEKKLLSEKNPLYGRATGIYKMTAMPFYDAVKFFPAYSDTDKVLAYAALGGIPHYLRQFDPGLPLGDNIRRHILTKGSVLYSEIEFFTRQELRETALYNTLLEAVALGNTQLGDIHGKTQIDKAKISVYLKNLMELEIVTREFSVLSGTKEKAASSRGLYRLTDHFFRFWFHFVFPNLSELETGDADGIYRYVVQPQLDAFASLAFEDICRAYLRHKNRTNELPFRFTKLGRWWGKAQRTVSGRRETYETEIDVMAVDRDADNYLIGECKFRNAALDLPEYRSLTGKFRPPKPNAACHTYLFSKSGFTEDLLALAARDGSVSCLTLRDIVGGADADA
ncbi:MAG: ATP-binding protein [Oscillospiraceae bacterium]|jgi:AAA+ ATPase superfamily predicted ATPase|nr:ATP-binding protein [Oscillospiraceae bacterium]